MGYFLINMGVIGEKRMELNFLLTTIATMGTVLGILFRLLLLEHKQQIITRDKEIDFLRKLILFFLKSERHKD